MGCAENCVDCGASITRKAERCLECQDLSKRKASSCHGVVRCRHALLAGECYHCPGNALTAEEIMRVHTLTARRGATREEAIRLVRDLSVEVTTWSGEITFIHG